MPAADTVADNAGRKADVVVLVDSNQENQHLVAVAKH